MSTTFIITSLWIHPWDLHGLFHWHVFFHYISSIILSSGQSKRKQCQSHLVVLIVSRKKRAISYRSKIIRFLSNTQCGVNDIRCCCGSIRGSVFERKRCLTMVPSS